MIIIIIIKPRTDRPRHGEKLPNQSSRPGGIFSFLDLFSQKSYCHLGRQPHLFLTSLGCVPERCGLTREGQPVIMYVDQKSER
jgi:hypothetical protein